MTCDLLGNSAKKRRLPGHRHHRPTTPTSSVKGRISPFGQSVTVFHISALGQAYIDEAASAINKSVNEYSAEENVPAEYVAKFSQRDIDDMTSQSCEDVQIIIGNLRYNVYSVLFMIVMLCTVI